MLVLLYKHELTAKQKKRLVMVPSGYWQHPSLPPSFTEAEQSQHRPWARRTERTKTPRPVRDLFLSFVDLVGTVYMCQ